MYQGSLTSDRMPNGPKWSRCNCRNKVHSERNALESSQNHSPNSWSMEKLYSMKLVSGAKKVADCWYIRSKIYCKSLKNIFPQANHQPNGHIWSLYHFKRNLYSLERFVMSVFGSIHRYIYGSPV